MTTILSLTASVQDDAKSLSRTLSRIFLDTWSQRLPETRVIHRDLAVSPPPHMSKAWGAANSTPPDQRNDAQREALAYSDAAIDEVEAADLIVIAAPMYNYGMPATLKAWFDQVIRVGRTLSFDLGRGDFPLASTLSGKRLVVLSSHGEFGFELGGIRQDWNFMDGHIATCAGYIGVAKEDIHSVSIDYQEFGDERFQRSVEQAKAAARELAVELSQ
ncbi:TPA: FMN-dependent NADH-azoreductase [Citrobacter farmeri]|uniref:FMN dependent NADH:quinone oxidoreductase n=1 Tax=Citrobacter farmeri TaxID=67824 RepID=A0A8H9NQT1_9ENTR|nr:NAD(P)H-dependent oxidoreductase [Citrobacter farmeri]NTY15638.1 FMN-dependent NADH-azoreductase [Citrobacter farmeri]HAT1583724.1 FMN-dependent NADH-azoreductase [Citrobacter farmeri]HCB1455853.1 NAD(P)H-dependent oxidoreductase [Citrobacter farmeri]HCB1606592.1 NAD(P)H-dependent oxidoreductase [Citrobacter farmeri]